MFQGKVLVTGAAGFIGFHLCAELSRRGCGVVGVDNINDYYYPGLKEARLRELAVFPNFTFHRVDLRDREALEGVFRQHGDIALVCNLAAQAGVRYSLTHPHAYEDNNIAAFLNVLEAAKAFKVERLVYASSSSVYGGNHKIPFSESDRVDEPISLYAVSKRANELMAHCYTHLYGMRTVGLRFFTVYGPWGRPDMAMWLFADAVRTGGRIKVFNYGNMRRDFTYIDDIISGVCGALSASGLEDYEIFNLGNNRSEQLLRAIGLVESALGGVAEKDMLPLQPGDVPESFADIERAKAKLGFNPVTSIDKGIPAFIDWYESHPELVAAIRDWRR